MIPIIPASNHDLEKRRSTSALKNSAPRRTYVKFCMTNRVRINIGEASHKIIVMNGEKQI